MPRFCAGLFFKTAALFILWMILSGRSDPIHMGLGLAVSFGVAWLNSNRAGPVFRCRLFFRMLWYFPWLFSRIVAGSWQMTVIILRPSLPIAPRLIHYHTDLRDRAAVALLGNSITLTPGTITVEVRERDLVVHAINAASADDLTSRRLERRVARVFRETRDAA